MIWGLTLKPGVSHTKVLDEEVHLSLASMESREEFGRIWPGSYAQVVVKTENVEFLLCTLVHGSMFQQTLDLKLMPKEKITFTAYGESIIYISGYSSSSSLIHKERGAFEQVINRAISTAEEASMNNDNEEDESSWIPDSEDQADEQKRRTGIQVKEEDEQDCIEVMSFENTDVLKKENYQTEEDAAGNDSAGEYSVVANIASYSLDNAMAPVQRAENHKTGNDVENSVEGQRMTNTGPVPTSLTKVESSSSKENRITRQTHIPQRTSFGSRQVVGILSVFPNAKMLSRSGSSRSSRSINLSDNHQTLQVQEGSDAGNYVYSVSSGASAEAAHTSDLTSSQQPSPVVTSLVSDPTDSHVVLSHTPGFKVKTDRSSNRLKSKKRSGVVQKKKMRGGKQYRCPFCQKAFMHAHSMVRHERIHTGVKPYQCRICLKKFSDIGNKAKHERTHTGGRGFECSYCGRTFTSCDAHLKHVKSCMR